MGNPPYIQLQKAYDSGRKYADLYKDQGYETFDRMGDIYCLFYEMGIKLLRPGGILTYISSNKWMRAGYGQKLRHYLSKYNPKILIDLGPGVFESSTVDTNILIIQKARNAKKLLATTVTENKRDHLDFASILKNNGVVLSKLDEKTWFIGNDAERRLKAKIERVGKPLREWNVRIYRGVLTGLNEAFIIGGAKRQEILNNCQDEDERRRTEAIIKPILRGRDIKRYYYEWAGLWLLFIPWHFPCHKDLSIQGASRKAENEFRRQFPAVHNHLLNYKNKLMKRNKEEVGVRYEWYALQRCAATYYDEFEKAKIVYPNMTKYLPFALDINKMYVNQKCFILTTNSVSLRFLLACFNSKISSMWIRNNCPELQGGTRELSYIFFKNIPLPHLSPSKEPVVKQIEILVDKILEAKKQNPQADTGDLEEEIDSQIYKLYGLTEEEINIVEENLE